MKDFSHPLICVVKITLLINSKLEFLHGSAQKMKGIEMKSLLSYLLSWQFNNALDNLMHFRSSNKKHLFGSSL
jgi:hypothetical protein